MKFEFLFIFICIIVINLKFNCNAEEKDQLIIGIDTNVPPMGFLDSNNNVVGFDIDLAKEAFKTFNKEVIFQPIDWDSKELELETEKIDVIWNGLSRTQEREQSMLLTMPYMKNRQVLIVRSDSQYESPDDLFSKTIAVQKGSTGNISLKNNPLGTKCRNIIELENMVSCLNEVKIGSSDAAVVDEVTAKYYLSKENNTDFKILSQELSTEDYVVAVKKGNTNLKRQIEQALYSLDKSGKASDISNKWFNEDILCIVSSLNSSSQITEKSQNNIYFTSLFSGLLQTLKLFSVCLIFSLPLGFVICMVRNTNCKLIKLLIDLYIRLIQGTPLLLQIYVLFYGLPYIYSGFAIKDRFLAGLLAFIINYSAYFAEIFRGGVKSIDGGQIDAIQILQISKFKAVFRIILPQVLKVSLPSVCNETISLVKDTALIFSIGVVELLSTAKNLVNTSANIFAYILVAIIYLVICCIVSICFKLLEKKFKFE